MQVEEADVAEARRSLVQALNFGAGRFRSKSGG